MESITISPKYQRWFPSQAHHSLSALADHFQIDLSSHRKRTKVWRVTHNDAHHGPLDVFVKAYATRTRFLDGFARRSRGLVEARHLESFQQWGITTPDVVASGFRRRLGGVCSDQSIIVTKAIPSLALLEFWIGLESPSSSEIRTKIIDALARQTRTLHAQHFFHQDLKWRNLLVDEEHRVFWIDCPSGYSSSIPWRQRHGRIKDLATLDMIAKDRCTEIERRRFIGVYLDTEDKSLIEQWAKAVLSYSSRRFR
ncbi:MAG: hypothetical protein ACI8T1_000028 [Verrucomicrobiales bacterium]